MRDSSCKISNKTVTGIEISFKEKDIKYLEFPFVYYMDDPIRKDHSWELFDCLSLRKRRNIINFNSGQLVEIIVKHWICYLMLAFREKIPIEVESFFVSQQVLCWLCPAPGFVSASVLSSVSSMKGIFFQQLILHVYLMQQQSFLVFKPTVEDCTQ